MTTDPKRPEVDDPRVLALATARQQLAHRNPFNAVCPPWEGLSEQEQRLSLLDARSYLHAAINAGLVPDAPAAVSSAGRAALLHETADAGLRDRIAEELAARFSPDGKITRGMRVIDPDDEDDPEPARRVLPIEAADVVLETLRRVAAEEQPAETQARPSHHRWYTETRDGMADEWAPGMRFTNRAEALDRYRTISDRHPLWKDGTPVERRFVRETTSYTVEDPTP